MENYENPGKSEESLVIHGHPWITMEIHKMPMDISGFHGYIHGYPWVSKGIHGYP